MNKRFLDEAKELEKSGLLEWHIHPNRQITAKLMEGERLWNEKCGNHWLNEIKKDEAEYKNFLIDKLVQKLIVL